jgi:hypothetical protein
LATNRSVRISGTSPISSNDGKVAVLLKRALERVQYDCRDRPRDKTKRTVILEFTIVPVVRRDEHELDHCLMSVQCKCKLPEYRTDLYQLKADAGGFQFNRDFAGELNQASLLPPEDDEDSEKDEDQ